MSAYQLLSRMLIGCALLGISAEGQAAKTAAPAAKQSEDAKQATLFKQMKVTPNETALFVGDMHCKTCAKKVAGKLYAVKGVMKVRTNVKADVAIITPQQKKKLDVNALWKAAQNAGFPPVKLVGPQGTYVVDPKTKGAQRLPDKKETAKKSGKTAA